MGLFSFFRDRRARESAIPGTEGSMSSPLGGQEPGQVDPLQGFGDLGAMIEQFKQAGAQVEVTNQVVDLRGTDARGEIFEVLRQHGVDPGGGGGAPDDPAALQRDILAALARSGLDLDGMGMGIPAAGEAPEPGELPAGLDPEELRRNPDAGIRNPLDR